MPINFDLPITEVVKGFDLKVKGSINVTTAGTLTPEGIAGLVRNVNIEATSGFRTSIGRLKSGEAHAFRNLSYFLSGEQPFTQTPSVAAVAAVPFEFVIPIDFEMLHTENPRLTLLNTRELTSLRAVVDIGDSSDVLATGAGSITGTIEVYAREFTDEGSKALQYGILRQDKIEIATPAANQNYLLDLKRGYMLRGLLLRTVTRSGYVGTPLDSIINRVKLQVNRETKYDFSWSYLQALGVKTLDIPLPVPGYAFIDLLSEQRLDTILDTALYSDVSLVLDYNQTANGVIDIYPVEIIPANL
jgi:hypothetical protein